jgi:hypothetical protein
VLENRNLGFSGEWYQNQEVGSFLIFQKLRRLDVLAARWQDREKEVEFFSHPIKQQQDENKEVGFFATNRTAKIQEGGGWIFLKPVRRSIAEESVDYGRQ